MTPGGLEADGQTSIGYDASTGRVWVDPPAQDPRPPLRPAEWREAGARLVGGCCGIGPLGIATIAQALGRAA